MHRFFTIFPLSLLIAVAILQSQVFSSSLPAITHYSMELNLFPKEGRLEAKVQMAITNNTKETHTEIPFLLYRLLEVQAAKDKEGKPLEFTQTVTKFTDENTFQVNLVKVHLKSALRPESTLSVVLQYSGSIFGYPEVMAYVRDRISEQYSLIRPDAFGYPMLSLPSWADLHSAYEAIFTYDLKVVVPQGYEVAGGGKLKNRRQDGKSVTFLYESKVPTWRMDIAVAKFRFLKDEHNQLSVYYLPEDEKGAANLLEGMKRAIAFYSASFGQAKNYIGYTAIEIPDGWGSQAGDGYLLQTAAAFTDSGRISELYHEIAHTWNVKAKPEVKRCRWFDEAFAVYFEALAIREFQGQPAFQEQMQRLREYFLNEGQKDKLVLGTPIANYGEHELGGLSYTKGAWSLYVLDQLVGEEMFKQIIRTLLAEFADRSADFHDFQALAERVTKKNLDKYFNEWIFGSESSKLLEEKIPVGEIVKRYQ